MNLLVLLSITLSIVEGHHRLRCIEDKELDYTQLPRKISNATKYPDGCCVEMSLEGLVDYFPAENYQIRQLSAEGYDVINFCRLRTPKKRFACCCNTSLCNSNEFLRYNLYNYLEQYNKETGFATDNLFILFLLLGVILSGVIAYYLSKFLVRQCEPDNSVEAHESKYVEERCGIILPQLGKGEMKQLKSQIRYARTTQRPEIKPLTGKPVITGVFTYNTNNAVTNRQLGPVELKIPKNGVTDFMAILMQMVSIGPRELRFPFSMLEAIIDEAQKVFLADPTLIDVPVPCQIYGDVHGQYSDLLRFFHLNGWPPTVRCLFLGDYVDRGRHSLEVIILLFLLKICMPYDVYMTRGNHEDYLINRAYSFYSELEFRIPNEDKNHVRVMRKFIGAFTSMPLAARIGKRALGMHGGLSPKLLNWETISEIERPCDLKKGTLECDLTWSDPDTNIRGYEPNLKRDPNGGMGYLFGVDAVEKTCQALKIEVMFRGHQCPMPGYELFAEKCITVFTAPGYRSASDGECNYGASIFLDHDFRLTITRIGVDETVRVLRDLQKLDKGDKYKDMDELVPKEHHDEC